MRHFYPKPVRGCYHVFVTVRFACRANHARRYNPGMSKALSRLGSASRTSSVKRWLIRNRVEFAAILAGIRQSGERPDWGHMARIMESEDLTDSNGNLISADALRVMWSRIESNPTLLDRGTEQVPNSQTQMPGYVAVTVSTDTPNGYREDEELSDIEAPEPKAKPISWLDRLRIKKGN